MVQDPLNPSRFFVRGNHASEYLEYWTHLSDYADTLCESNGLVFIDARDIEGIYLFDSEVSDFSGFWERRGCGTQDSLMEIARQIPVVKSMLEKGGSFNDIRAACPDLNDCIDIYFEGAPEVSRAGDFYVFVGNGRHREMAAQAIDGMIPVKIKRVIRHNV